jgi:hypothetical protein
MGSRGCVACIPRCASPGKARKPFSCPLLDKYQRLYFCLLLIIYSTPTIAKAFFTAACAAGKGAFHDLGLMKHLVTLSVIKMYL